MKNKIINLCILLALTLFSSSVLAHNGVHDGSLISGLIHPVSGIDHILAMLAVGLWAATLNKSKKQLLLPVAFVLFMVFGALMGVIGIGLPMIETGIALTVVFMGLLIMTKTHTHYAIAALLVGVFALIHGNAHGLEIGVASTLISYFIGFISCTSLLLGVGFFTGRRLVVREWTVRGIGMTTSITGSGLLLGV